MPAILLTRPAPASARFAQDLRARLGDVRIVTSPLLRIDWRTPDLPRAEPIFTSRNGVEGFLRAGGRGDGRCWCVGEATAQAAQKAGFQARPGPGDAAALVRAILTSGAPGPFVHIRGTHITGDLSGPLRAAGLTVDEAVVYDQIAEDLNSAAKTLLGGEISVVLPLFSPRTAVQFTRTYGGTAPLFVAAMSPAVKAALDQLPVTRIVVAGRPDAPAMIEAVEGLFDAALQLEGQRGDR